jgi:hypothetical protein
MRHLFFFVPTKPRRRDPMFRGERRAAQAIAVTAMSSLLSRCYLAVFAAVIPLLFC